MQLSKVRGLVERGETCMLSIRAMFAGHLLWEHATNGAQRSLVMNVNALLRRPVMVPPLLHLYMCSM